MAATAVAGAATTIAPWLGPQLRRTLPPVAWAMAYGSGVFKQKGYAENNSAMVDMILAVDDPTSWHGENIRRNPGHYSGLRHLGPAALDSIQDKYGAGVYFNTLVPMGGRTVKYGVITVDHLVRDLQDWDTLYTAGRMHKPVCTVVENSRVSKAMETNRRHAVHTSLLMLPPTFSPSELFLSIAGLSYAGDIRMGFAENPAKVRNIVHGSFAGFVEVYADITDASPFIQPAENGKFEDTSPEARHAILSSLPRGILATLPRLGSNPSDSLQQISRLPSSEVSKLVHRGVSRLVSRSSASQSLKGLATAGAAKSAVYLWAKVKKRFS